MSGACIWLSGLNPSDGFAASVLNSHMKYPGYEFRRRDGANCRPGQNQGGGCPTAGGRLSGGA